jgi:hypothetical protein
VNFDKVFELLRALERDRVDYVLVGGVASNLHGITRATQDVDIMLRLDETNVARLRKALRQVWDDSAIEEIQYSDLADTHRKAWELRRIEAIRARQKTGGSPRE